jgi:hypothetical protein
LRRHSVALIVEGGALAVVLAEEHHREFLTLCQSCQAVICCRVSPIQKVSELLASISAWVDRLAALRNTCQEAMVLLHSSCRQRWPNW